MIRAESGDEAGMAVSVGGGAPHGGVGLSFCCPLACPSDVPEPPRPICGDTSKIAETTHFETKAPDAGCPMGTVSRERRKLAGGLFLQSTAMVVRSVGTTEGANAKPVDGPCADTVNRHIGAPPAC